jgi:hypothetical protein
VRALAARQKVGSKKATVSFDELIRATKNAGQAGVH